MEMTATTAKTTWVLGTEGDVQWRVQNFLAALWERAGLDGMIVPVYQTESGLPGPKILWHERELQDADPFVPLVRMKTSRMVEELAKQKPALRMAAVLHSCEARALAERYRQDDFSLENWLLIGVDCLASFPQADYEWRLERAGNIRHLTQEILRNARQGGISTDRFRSACQMCTRPDARDVDLCIGVIGLPLKEFALLIARDHYLAEKLGLSQIADQPAPGWLIDQRQRVLGKLAERHEHVKQRIQAELENGFPQDVQEWIEHLHMCSDCRACLDACPLYADQLEAGVEAVAEWLAACVACGICDDVCPEQMPLTAIIERIMYSRQSDFLPA